MIWHPSKSLKIMHARKKCNTNNKKLCAPNCLSSNLLASLSFRYASCTRFFLILEVCMPSCLPILMATDGSFRQKPGKMPICCTHQSFNQEASRTKRMVALLSKPPLYPHPLMVFWSTSSHGSRSMRYQP